MNKNEQEFAEPAKKLILKEEELQVAGAALDVFNGVGHVFSHGFLLF